MSVCVSVCFCSVCLVLDIKSKYFSPWLLCWHISTTSHGDGGQDSNGPDPRVHGGSHSSASLGRTMPDHWKGEFVHKSSLRCVRVVGHWTNSVLSRRFEGFCPTSLHVFLEKAFDLSALWVWGLWPIATSCTFPMQQFEKLGPRFWNQSDSRWQLDSATAALCHWSCS